MPDHEIVANETLYEGWGKLLKLTIRLPNGGTMSREVEDHGSAVAVLPYDAERRMALLIRQFRAPPFLVAGDGAMLEAPAGLLEEHEPTSCARREAQEEAGLRLRSLEPLGMVWTMPGISTERIHLFVAPYAPEDRVSEGGGLETEHEEIEAVEVELRQLAALADRGELRDLKTLALVQALRLRRPELFK